MKTVQDHGIAGSALAAPPTVPGDTAPKSSCSGQAMPPRQSARAMVQRENWDRSSKRWGRLMAKAQAGDSQAYEQLLRELDAWLCRYYARRLPHSAADDARQNTLLAIHAKRHTYMPSKPFGAWVFAIARYKWIDCIRDASRYAPLSPEAEIPVEDHGHAAISAATLDQLLGQLKPSQESVIRLVKLRGLSIASASGATGQSASLVKINIHRGLKKLAALVS
jgi:RNA polymerase sigma factor (sigma-70 family)